MKISVTQSYNEPGEDLPFGHEMQGKMHDELSDLCEPSSIFLDKYGPDYEIAFYMDSKSGINDVAILGPGVYKKGKSIEFALKVPFDVILTAADGPRCALQFLFKGIRTVLHRYEIDTGKLDANEERIINEICSNPAMFDGGWENTPWPTLENYKPPPPPAPADPNAPAFKRVYKRIDGILFYESVGAVDGMAHHRKGKVGTQGKVAELPYAGNSPQKAVDTFLGPAIAKGFTELGEDHEIEIQYVIDGFGSETDLEKLHALEDHLDNLLGSLGLGSCSENSIGGDTMEVSCFVVDADIAMKAIRKNLKSTRFADYARIHLVEQDDEDDEE